ncbi:MAG: hypothetical protein N4A71_11080 [Carboxylicivirga sp.]|jgi:hypothetical protein|nr:hypothetical protein [Carboxylicivirga sp.]
MNKDVTKIAAAAGGAFIGGAAMKLMKKADGTSNPIASLISVAGGTYLVLKGKSEATKALGLGLAAVGTIGVVAKVAEKVPAMGKFAPSINGLGELYYDEDGNIVDLDGLNGGPQFVQDENGQTYMIEGLAGDEVDDLYDDEVDDDMLIAGLAGEEDDMLMAA